MNWKPNVTVAAVIENDGKFLCVEEVTDDGVRFNQPAGHLECREALTEAVIREVLEETGYSFAPEALVGIYNWRNEARDITYLRFVFTGRATGHDAARPLDEGIIAARWLTLAELRERQAQLRSPMVLQCVEDWCAGKRAPLDLITHYPCR
ncbi:NUDIX hydrolase [Propionivibrio dicarboxylicus]|uniref:Phosphatase NudJ n=1 Tax=Propionivibrio dicarboxylicus TaxID=83767 RepID=A0A1G8BME7_9RHOO|nr:NUDIX hydrolase [Propionivibrio dicarboxylicus]SDH34283.1 ADP-ribose pyrophosphatase YjhB, NUDIX family [Propionivibrio dicarboxylicus]